MLRRVVAILLFASPALFAATFTYNVAVNTAALSGAAGTLYFQFNPGDLSSDAATATISNFSGASLLGSPLFSGNAAGALGSSLTLANAAANNDALQAVTFGALLAFRITLAETFSGIAGTGSVFNFGVYQNDGLTPLLTTQPDGYSVIINLDTVNSASAQSTTNAATVARVPSGVPEPGTLLSLGGGFGVFLLARRRAAARV